MRVIVNDHVRDVPPGTTLAGLLEVLRSDRRGLAVEVDGRLVPPSQWERVQLRPDQKIELVRVVGGG